MPWGWLSEIVGPTPPIVRLGVVYTAGDQPAVTGDANLGAAPDQQRGEHRAAGTAVDRCPGILFVLLLLVAALSAFRVTSWHCSSAHLRAGGGGDHGRGGPCPQPVLRGRWAHRPVQPLFRHDYVQKAVPAS
jgi:hypothetical protein